MNLFPEDQKKDMEGRDPSTGRFAVGNDLWRINMARIGAPLIFKTAQDLLDACAGYFEWAEANPLQEQKVFGTGNNQIVNHPNPISKKSLCSYLGIAVRTWDNYRDRDDFKAVCEGVENHIDQYLMAGATTGFFNANLIARQLGLVDRQSVEEVKTVLTEQEQIELLEPQLPFLIPMLRQLGYSVEKIVDDAES